MSDLQKKLIARGLPPMLPPLPSSLSTGNRKGGRKKDYSPLLWNSCFDRKQLLQTDAGEFCVYTKGEQGPLILCLHGGGFSSLTWALFTQQITSSVNCQVLAFDQRGHGETQSNDDSDLNIATLVGDVSQVLSTYYKDNPVPPVIFVGHSMGGAVAVNASLAGAVPSLIGLIVIDVVEGSALEALSGMKSFLRGRPPLFKSLEHAIEWSVRSGQIKNIQSARISMSGQVRPVPSGNNSKIIDGVSADSIPEETEDEPSNVKANSSAVANESSNKEKRVEWRVNLENSEKFWLGWFEKLSSKFLDVPVPKILLLAGVDRLDKDLAIGQMQGKFQMHVVGNVGHAVHEDAPDQVADVIATFIVRHKFAEPGENFSRVMPIC